MDDKRASLFRERWMEDNDNVYCQVAHPFRLKSTGFGVVLELPFKILLATLLYGGVPMSVLMFLIPIFGKNGGGVLIIVLLCVWCMALITAYTKQVMACYDKKKSEFIYRKCLLGRTLKEYTWPVSMFEGISYGHHVQAKAQPVHGVRLHTMNKRFVLGFLYANSDESAKEYAEKLSIYCGLPNFGVMTTGRQHVLDDIRGFA